MRTGGRACLRRSRLRQHRLFGWWEAADRLAPKLPAPNLGMDVDRRRVHDHVEQVREESREGERRGGVFEPIAASG